MRRQWRWAPLAAAALALSAALGCQAAGSAPPRAAAPAASAGGPAASPPTAARAAAEEGRFPTVASLRGRQIAVASQGSSAEFGMMRVLGQAGLGRDDVQL